MGQLDFGPLHADFYAFTMGDALFRAGDINKNTTFQSFIRKPPFGGSYLITAGLQVWLDWLKDWAFTDAHLAYLRAQTYADGTPLFSEGYLDWLRDSPLQIDVTVLAEGELAFTNTPIAIIHGPVGQCLIVEAMLLNIINSQSLIATVASRCRLVAGDDPMVEGGLRRAQDTGGFGPTRAAFIGGFNATSNTAAAFALGIPVKGTFAHAYVTFHATEGEAFNNYATHMPVAPSFLVDTYNTLNGVKTAIEACKAHGIKPGAIRLDSGDLGWLSQQAKNLLVDAGFPDTKIVASNDLDAHSIAALKQQQKEGNAHIDMWLVGTNVVTAAEQPALGGVYKLVEVDGRKVIKVAERTTVGTDSKTTIPGAHMAIRYLRDTPLGRQWYGDTILPEDKVQSLVTRAERNPDGTYILPESIISVDLNDPERPKEFPAGTTFIVPYKEVMKNGREIDGRDTLPEIQKRVAKNLGMLAPEHKRLNKPHVYVSGIEEELYDERRHMIRDIHLATRKSLSQAKAA